MSDDEVDRLLSGFHEQAREVPPEQPMPVAERTCSLCRVRIDDAHEHYVRGCGHTEHAECHARMLAAGRVACRECSTSVGTELQVASGCDAEARARAMDSLRYRRQKVRPLVVARWHTLGACRDASAPFLIVDQVDKW